MCSGYNVCHLVHPVAEVQHYSPHITIWHQEAELRGSCPES